MPVIVSVMGTSDDEFVRLVRRSRWAAGGLGAELNVSCPNVKSGLIVGESPEEARSARAVRPLTEKPLIVKLTPNIADPVPVALAAQEGGADAVSLINTAGRRDPILIPARVAGRRDRALGPGGPAALARAVSAAASVPVTRWAESRPVGTPRTCSGPERRSLQSAQRASGTRPRDEDRGGASIGDRIGLRLGRRFFANAEIPFSLLAAADILAAPMQAPVQSSSAAPERSLDQRMEALKRANDIRRRPS